ncbi:MAG: hypothetical protein ACRC6K_02890 [Fusobacteriaceae bacterium]
MTIEQKNLLLFFLEQSENDKGCAKQKTKVLSLLNNLQEKLEIKHGTNEKKIFVNLEDEILNLFSMTSRNYFDFGMFANDIVENDNLEWGLEEVV